jgi:hypothetical protein
MDIHEKIINLLVASGNVPEEKVEQARKLAESLVWDGEAARQSARVGGADWFCEECGHSNQSKQDECYFCQSPNR